MMPHEEQWKPVSVAGCRGLYEVSDQGAVMSLRTGRILAQQIVKGHTIVCLKSHNNRKISVPVGRLVLMTFRPIAKMSSWVASWKNNNKADNRLTNLEWGPRRSRSKLTDEAVRTIRARWLQGEASGADLSRAYGVSECAISNIINGKTWQHPISQGV